MHRFATVFRPPLGVVRSVVAMALGAGVAATAAASQAPSAPPGTPPVIPGGIPAARASERDAPAKVEVAGRWRDSKGRPVIGLRFTMSPRWHIYWRNPGDSGMPPRVEATLPKGWSLGTIDFPRPDVLRHQGELSIGYEKSAVLLLHLEAPAEAPAGRGTLAVRYLVCKEVCIAGEATVEVTLPAAAEIGALAEIPPVIDQRSYPRTLEALGGRARLDGGTVRVDGPWPEGAAKGAEVGFISLDLPGVRLPGGPLARGSAAGPGFELVVPLEPDPASETSQTPAIGGLVTFGARPEDPCAEFVVQVPKPAAR